MSRVSQIVLGSDGTVLAASGDVPAGIVDQRLDGCQSVALEIREAGAELLRELHRSGHRVAAQSVSLDAGRRQVQLVAIEAMVIRRAAVDLRALLSSKLAILSSQAAAAQITLSVTVADSVPATVRLDSEKIAWVVTTLVGNALRYVQAGLRRMNRAAIDVRVRFDAEPPCVVIEVQDDGPGIPADTLARLFGRDGLNVQGAGLALIMMSDICAAHGGTIEISSSILASAHGTTVRFTIPVNPAPGNIAAAS